MYIIVYKMYVYVDSRYINKKNVGTIYTPHIGTDIMYMHNLKKKKIKISYKVTTREI